MADNNSIGYNVEEIIRTSRSINETIGRSAKGVVDRETLENANLVPARLRESYIYYRTYLIRTVTTTSKQERLEAIRFQVYGEMRRSGYSNVFRDKMKMKEVDRFIDEFFGETAEHLAALKVHQLDMLFLMQGKREQETKAETWQQEHVIRFGPNEKEMPHL